MGGMSVGGAWGASRRNDWGPGVGVAQHALGGAVHTGSAQQGQVAHGGHTEEGVGALKYTWCRVRPSRIGGASPGSNRRGWDSKQMRHGESEPFKAQDAAWSAQLHFQGNQSHSKLRKRHRSSEDLEGQHGEGTELQWGAEGKGSQCGGGARAMMEND
ncbi:hypothetical protein B0H14DRAFT_2585623 [Mycena olivaceomarginata]|nr:hypothetical protein B0H14DRAFT_2585623 [Mycena olivaceomarginata]